jgi:hypothetical protein
VSREAFIPRFFKENLRKFRSTLRCAGDVVEQHVVLAREQLAASRRQMRLQRLLAPNRLRGHLGSIRSVTFRSFDRTNPRETPELKSRDRTSTSCRRALIAARASPLNSAKTEIDRRIVHPVLFSASTIGPVGTERIMNCGRVEFHIEPHFVPCMQRFSASTACP